MGRPSLPSTRPGDVSDVHHRRPDHPARRDTLLDALRGAALFGILLVHVCAFASPGAPSGLLPPGTPADRTVALLTLWLADSKFFSLFTFLFGLSFALQMRRGPVERGDPAFARRMLALLALGGLHVLLLWEADVLMLYAAAGLLLWRLRLLPDRALVRWAALLLGVPALLATVATAGLAALHAVPGAASELARVDAALAAQFAAARAEALPDLTAPSYATLTAARFDAYLATLPLLALRLPTVLGMFVLGLLAGRAGLARPDERHRPLLRRVAIGGTALGLLAGLPVVLAQLGPHSTTAVVSLLLNQTVAGPLAGLGYAAALALLWGPRLRSAGSSPPGVVGPLVTLGRMSLTAYLTQSLLLILTYGGIGLGLAGRIGVAGAPLVAAALFALQLALSGWWARHLGLGPVERISRRFVRSGSGPRPDPNPRPDANPRSRANSSSRSDPTTPMSSD